MDYINMDNLGFNPRFAQEARLYEGLYVGRITSQFNHLYKVITEKGELIAEVSGKFHYHVEKASDLPAVGDFVMLDRNDDYEGNGIIHHLLKRKSVFIRKASGTSSEEQVVAANIDTVFICMSLNQDFNIRRIERYLGIAWDSGAIPVIVLTKSDLCDNLSEKLSILRSVALGVDVIVTSSISEDGLLPVKKHISPGKTIAFIGSSGVGKSTLINKLMNEDRIETKEIGFDDKGRHTTTRREMYILPEGGVVIDTPGMREIGIENADLAKAFADIDELAANCKFKDCTHTKEPKCAVLDAINAGLLSRDRFASYLKLKKEVKYDGLNSRQIENEKLSEMFKDFGGIKGARKYIKEKSKK